MNRLSLLPQRLDRAFSPTSQGVVGVVEELLLLAREQDLQMVWQEGFCLVDFSEGSKMIRVKVAIPKAVFRAALARVAVLCNEEHPSSVNPYGGEGLVHDSSKSGKTIRVTFVNTPEKQSLTLIPEPVRPEDSIAVSSLPGLAESSSKG